MTDSNRIHFEVTGDASQAERELREFRIQAQKDLDAIQGNRFAALNAAAFERKKVADAVRLQGSQFAKDLASHVSEASKSIDKFEDFGQKAGKGLDTFSKGANNARSSAGQFIEALAQGDPGELLGEIAQQGGKAGLAIAGIGLAAGAAAFAMGAMTARMIELVRETDKLAKDTKLTSTQIQGLQIVANLTGESVEDLAENYKKIGPEVKRFEDLVKSSGAAIDDDLRRKVQDSSLAWEELKISAQGALNAIARESLPAVNGLLREMGVLIRDGANAWTFFGQVGGGAIQTLTTLLRQLRTDAVQTIIDLTSGPAGILNLVSRDGANIGKDLAAPTGAAFPKIPSFKGGGKGGGGGGAKDIKAIEVEMQALKNQIAEAEREAKTAADSIKQSFDDKSKLLELRTGIAEAERAAFESLGTINKVFEAKSDLLDLEIKIAQTEKLPNKRAKELLEIEEKRKAISFEREKELKDTGETLNDEIKRGTEYIKEQERAYTDLLITLEDVEQATRAIRNETERIKVGILADSNLGKLNPRVVTNKSADAAINGENLRADGFALSMDEQRNKLDQSFEDNLIGYDEYQARLRALHLQEEAERERHKTAIEAIEQGRVNSLQQVSELSEAFNDIAQSVFGEGTENAVEFSEMMQGAFNSFAQGVGDMVEQYVLLGTAGPDAMRKLTASVLAGLAKQAAIKAIFELAEGFASLFVNPAGAAAHFTAAAIFGSIAGVAAVAGRAIAGDSFKSKDQKGQASSSKDGSGKLIIDKSLPGKDNNFIEITRDGERSQSSGDSESKSGLSSVASFIMGTGKASGSGASLEENVARIRDNTDLIVETTRFAREPMNRARNFISGVLGSIIPGFADGGHTGGGARGSIAGFVHAREFVVNETGMARLGRFVLEATNASNGQLFSLPSMGNSPAFNLSQQAAAAQQQSEPKVILVRAEYQPGIIVKEVRQDYQRNGSMRETFRNDIGGEGASIV